MICLIKMSISWIIPSAQESYGVILIPSTVNISAAFEGLVENGKTCSHGISPLSINCLPQFPSIHSRKTYEKNLHTPIAQALICSKSHIESTFVLVVHYVFVFSWLTMRNNTMCQ